jgi:hypothetical protein
VHAVSIANQRHSGYAPLYSKAEASLRKRVKRRAQKTALTAAFWYRHPLALRHSAINDVKAKWKGKEQPENLEG